MFTEFEMIDPLLSHLVGRPLETFEERVQNIVKNTKEKDEEEETTSKRCNTFLRNCR